MAHVRLPAVCAVLLLVGLSASPVTARELSFEQRVAAQEAIARVYYRHQLGVTESFEAAVPRTVVEDRVRKYLQQSSALEQFWSTPVTAPMLERELARIAAQTKMPERLTELYAALRYDVFSIEECLARPLLVDRLARNFFAFDRTIHLGARAEAERVRADLERGRIDPRADHRLRSVLDLSRTGDESHVDGPDDLRRLAPERAGEIGAVVEARDSFTVRLVLDEPNQGVRLVTYTVAKRSWDDWWNQSAGALSTLEPQTVASGERLPAPHSNCGGDAWDTGVLQSDQPPAPRAGHSAVWTGSWVIVWGGGNGSLQLGDGAKYDPATDTWSPMTAVSAPARRQGHTAVWTGIEMIVWGGWAYGNVWFASGGRYDPIADEWRPTSLAGAPSERQGHTAVWTGSRMIVWGGDRLGLNVQTGSRYDPATDTWSPTSLAGAPSARSRHVAVWTGSVMVVAKGAGPSPQTGGRYDPTSNSWTSAAPSAPTLQTLEYATAVWTGSSMIVWGGLDGTGFGTSVGQRYDPTSDFWTPTSTVGVPAGRYRHAAVWTGTDMVVWGGQGGPGGQTFFDSGGRYDPVANTWLPTSLANAPSTRVSHSAVWTGSRMVVWGGDGPATSADYLDTGGRYDPATDTWTPTTTSSGMPYAPGSSLVWTGNEMIVWGGYHNAYLDTGGRYDLTTDSWTPTALSGAPSGRTGPTAVWSGNRMIVWGGRDDDVALNSGGRYDPVADQWFPTALTGAPQPRVRHSAVWTGARMIVWGGNSDSPSYSAYQSGGRYDPVADQWSPTSTSGAPTAREGHTTLWTGSQMIVWGGMDELRGATNTGARYSPDMNIWRPITTQDAPVGSDRHTAVWTGNRMIVWGGFSQSAERTGGRYDPVADTWATTTITGAPQARLSHSAVWTGSEMVIWGGNDSPYTPWTSFASGGRYDPALDSWKATTLTGVPDPRGGHHAVWIGDSMLIWGGQNSGGAPTTSGARYLLGLASAPDTDGDGACGDEDCDPVNPQCTTDCTDADGDGFCVTTDCNDASVGCTTTCTDADGDGLPSCAGDCSDQNSHCTTSCVDQDGDGFCVTTDCNDAIAGCTTDCTDADGDGLAVCAGDCSDQNSHCTTSCVDQDGDGFCFTTDCDDQSSHCTTSCTDQDGDGFCVATDCDDQNSHCTTSCTDQDGDGFCVTTDCNDANANCTTSCTDADGDGFCVTTDCNDANANCTTSCTDADGDGFCATADCNDGNPHCTTSCFDADADGFCVTSDCDDNRASCTTDCTDADGDTLPACGGDCDDRNLHCTTSCVDADGDGFCAEWDCDDAHASCTTSCVDTDGDGLSLCAGDCDDTSVSCTTSCVDADGDGLPACADCNDANPYCTTICHDGDGDGRCVPYDCDDSVATCTTTCVDADADGWRPCTGDCNDASPAAHPGGSEVCIDGLDNDCNGLTDSADAACSSLVVSGLRFTSHAAVTWDPAAAADAYALYRGTFDAAGLRSYDHLCEATELAAPAAEDADAPPMAEGYYYLATAFSIGPAPLRTMAVGSLGQASSGTQIPESSTVSCGPRVFVDPASLARSPTGLSWADAYTTVGGALRQGGSPGRGLEVWITGAPSDVATLDGSVRPGARLLGGFAGNESASWQRSPGATPTVWQHGGTSRPLLRGIGADLVVDGMTLRNDHVVVLASLAGDRLELTDVRLEQTGYSGIFAVDLAASAGGHVLVRNSVLPAPIAGGIRAVVTGGTLTGRLDRNRLDGGSAAALWLEARAAGSSNAEVRLNVVGNTISGGPNGVVLGAHVVNQARTATQSSYLASNVIHGSTGSLVTVEATGSFTTASGAAAARAVPLLVGNTLSDGGAGVTCSATRSDSTGNPTGHEVRATPELWDNLITFSDGAGIAESSDNVAAALFADPIVVGNDLYGNGELYRDEGTTSLGTIAQVNALSGAQDNYAADPLYIDRPAEDYHLSSGVLVAFGWAMRYLANSSDPTLGMSWVQPTFDDSGWNSGSYGVGYDTAPPPNAVALLQTVVPAGQASVFSRTTFTIDDLAEVQTLTLGADFDDGYAAWINGVEVFRSASLPPGALAWNTAAAAHESSNGAVPSYEEQDITFVGIPALVEGTNVLAVAVWNDSPASSDLVLVPLLEIDNGSPAVDAGHLAPPRSTRADIDGEARNRDGNGDGVARPDTGADEQ